MVAKIPRYLQFSPSSHSYFWCFTKYQNGRQIHNDISRCLCLSYKPFCKIHTALSLLFQTQQFNNNNGNIKSRRMRWAGHVACMGEERGVYRVLVGKPEGKRPLERPRHRWVDNIRMDLQEVYVGIWTGLGWPRIETGGGHL